MQTTDFRSAIIDYIRQQARPVDKFGHQPRLYALTREIGAGLTYDDDVVFAGVWLHDLGVFIGHRPEDLEALARWDSMAYAVERSPDVLRSLGFPEVKIAGVVEVIRGHMPSGDPTTLEGVIVRDADILEQLGAVGILRTVSKVGRDTRFPLFFDALQVLQKNFDTLPGLLRLPVSRQLAERRLKMLGAFLEAARLDGVVAGH